MLTFKHLTNLKSTTNSSIPSQIFTGVPPGLIHKASNEVVGSSKEFEKEINEIKSCAVMKVLFEDDNVLEEKFDKLLKCKQELLASSSNLFKQSKIVLASICQELQYDKLKQRSEYQCMISAIDAQVITLNSMVVQIKTHTESFKKVIEIIVSDSRILLLDKELNEKLSNLCKCYFAISANTSILFKIYKKTLYEKYHELIRFHKNKSTFHNNHTSEAPEEKFLDQKDFWDECMSSDLNLESYFADVVDQANHIKNTMN